jgi:hypothetical protein
LEEGEGCARVRVRLPSHPLTIYRGKGRGGGALEFPLGGGGQGRLDLPRETLGRLAPQAKQVEACLPSQVEAPHLPKQHGKVCGGAQPLSGLVCPLPLAHETLQHLPGPPKHLSVMLAIAWYPRNTSGLQYPSSNISIFASGPFRSSSSHPGSHSGL